MSARHAAKTQFRLPSKQAQHRAALALVAALTATVVGAVSAMAGSSPTLVASTTDTLTFLQHQRDACQVMLDSATTSAQRTRARTCISDVERAIAALLATPTPTPTVTQTTPSPSPTASPTPTPTPSPTSTTGWPGPDNTGVPAGVTLTPYTGPCTITVANTIIDAKTVNCNLTIKATGVVVTRSLINGTVGTDEATPYSFALTDTEVNAPVVQAAAVGTTHFSLLRANVHGGALSVYCWAHCRIEDSWLHGQALPADANWHLGALRADENDDPHNDADPAHDAGITDLVAVHNKVACDTPANSSDGGCSGGVTMYGDFGTINGVTLDRNLLVASTDLSYCLYGGSVSSKPFPNAHDIVVTGNVFGRGANGKCGAYGPVSAYDVNAPGNLWQSNVWDAGGSVAPSL